MTTANKITIFRILLIPVFIAELLYYTHDGQELYRILAIAAFLLASISDGIDGYIARRYHQFSELGRILDPLADKMLLISGIILLSLKNEPYLPRIPLWLTVTILSRDVLIVVGFFIVHHFCGRTTVRPILLGKAAAVLQMACVLWALLKWPADWLVRLSLATALLTTLSGLFYLRDGIRQLSASPHSSPTPGQPP